MKSLTLLVLLVTALTADHGPELLRIIVIDTSGSTSGGPLDEVKRQLREELQKHPPTAHHPLSVVTYDTVAQAPKTFHQLDQALAFIDGLESGGGTEPAEGLRIAIELLKQQAARRDVTVIWLHDGDEGDPQATEPQLQKLDELFKSRGRQGLAQSVQLRTWSGQGGMTTITARLKANPYVNLVAPDAPLPLAPVVSLGVECDVSVDNVRRGPKPGELVVRCLPQVTLRGTIPKDRAVAHYVFALRRDLPKNLSWTVLPTAPPTPHELVVAATPSEINNGQVKLRFQLTPDVTASAKTGRRLIAPPPRPEIVKSVPIPGYPRPYQFAARLTVQAKPTWLDAANHVALFDAELKLAVRCVDPWVTQHPAVTLRIVGVDDTDIVTGPREVRFARPDVQVVQLKLKRAPSSTAKDAATDNRLRIKISPQRGDATVVFTPADCVAESGPVPLPAATVTTLNVAIEQMSAPLWHRPPNLAAFQATLRVVVDGMLPPDSELVVTASPGSSILRIEPKQIHTGDQLVAINMLALLRPAPDVNHLELMVNPPPDSETIHVVSPTSIKIDLPGPASAHLVVRQDGLPTLILSRTVASGARAVQVPVALELDGPVTRTFAGILRAKTGGQISTQNLPLYQTVSLPVHLSPTADSDYFFDETEVIRFNLGPEPASAPVASIRAEAHITRQAPFKQHLFLGLTAAIALVTPYLLVRLALSMRPSQDLLSDQAGDRSLAARLY